MVVFFSCHLGFEVLERSKPQIDDIHHHRIIDLRRAFAFPSKKVHLPHPEEKISCTDFTAAGHPKQLLRLNGLVVSCGFQFVFNCFDSVCVFFSLAGSTPSDIQRFR